MPRWLILYTDYGQEDDCDNHVVRDMNWHFNECGLSAWMEDNYKFHYGQEPEITFYQVTSDFDQIYTRQQFYDTIKHYWKTLKHKLRNGQCYFFPPVRTKAGMLSEYVETGWGRLKLTMDGDKIPIKEQRVIDFYETWIKDLIDFAKEYLTNTDLSLCCS